MIKLLLYHALVLCCLSSLFTGRRWVLYALAFCAPMVEILPSPYGFILSPPNAILLGLVGLTLHAEREKDTGRQLPNSSMMVVWTVVLFIGVLRTLLVPPQSPLAINSVNVVLTAWYWTTPFIVFALVYRAVTTREMARWIIAVCMFSALAEAMLGFYERLQGVGRATAHLADPNKAGAYFGATAALMLAFVLVEKGRMRWLFTSGWVLATGALFATLSRGGLFAAVLAQTVVFGVFFMFSGHKSIGAKTGYLVLAFLIVLNVSLILPQRVMDRILVTVGAESAEIESVDNLDTENLDGSSEGRLALWRSGLALYREQPSGYGAFTSIALQARFRAGGKAMHNIYLQVLVEHGIQGLICLLLFITTVGWNLWRRFRLAEDDPEISALFLGLLGYWIALCAAHFFVNPFFMLQLNGQFWVMSACALRNGPDPLEAR